MHEECRKGHVIRGPQDRTRAGWCRHCEHHRAARYRDRRRVAVALFKGLEERGISVTKDNLHRTVTLLEMIHKADTRIVEALFNQADSDQLEALLSVAEKVPTTGHWA